jgi:hypothetical protein
MRKKKIRSFTGNYRRGKRGTQRGRGRKRRNNSSIVR